MNKFLADMLQHKSNILLNVGAEGERAGGVLLLFKEKEIEPDEYVLNELQADIIARSLFEKDEDGDDKMYADEKLMKGRDVEKPMADVLFSVMQAYSMLEKRQTSGAMVSLNTELIKEGAIPLTVVQASVVIARLGINLEKDSFADDDKLNKIYGTEWAPEFQETVLPEKKAASSKENTILRDICNPRKLKRMLDKAIIGQDDVKEKLAMAVYEQEIAARVNALHKHDKGFVPLKRKNMLLYGPSGSGKTALIKKLAAILDRPVVIFDTTTLTPSGYHGNSTDAILNELLAKADGDVDKASHGIVYLDEWDKAFIGASGNIEMASFKGAAASFELLRMMDGCEMAIDHHFDTIHINTGNILFIVGGAFPNLDWIVRERLEIGNRTQASSIGFMRSEVKMPKPTVTDFPDATLEDLKKYGIPTEILGRISTICRLKPLGCQELVKVLAQAEQSPLHEYSKLFSLHNITLKVTPKTMEAIAEKALEQNLGVRGLTSILEQVLTPVLFKVAGNKRKMILRLRPECITKGIEPVLLKNNKTIA